MYIAPPNSITLFLYNYDNHIISLDLFHRLSIFLYRNYFFDFCIFSILFQISRLGIFRFRPFISDLLTVLDKIVFRLTNETTETF